MKKVFYFFFVLPMLIYAGSWNYLALDDQEIRAIAVHPEDPAVIFAGGDFLYRSSDTGKTWDTVSFYDVNCIKFHPFKPDTLYITYGDGSWSDGIYRSTDLGETWNVLFYLLYSNSLEVPDFKDSTIFVGSDSYCLYRSDDLGVTWGLFNDSALDNNILSIESVYTHDSLEVYLAGTRTGIWRYLNPWLPVSPSLTGVDISIYNNAYPIIWAALDGGSYSDGVYKSVDYGLHWSVSHFFPYITDVLVSRQDSSIIYACADLNSGIFVSYNEGSTWIKFNEGLGDSTVYCLAQSPSDSLILYAGTSHGIYVYDITTGVEEILPGFKNQQIFQLKSNILISNDELEIIFDVPVEMTGTEVSIIFYDISGRIQDVIYSGILNPGLERITVDITSKNGCYFIGIIAGEYRIVEKLSVFID